MAAGDCVPAPPARAAAGIGIDQILEVAQHDVDALPAAQKLDHAAARAGQQMYNRSEYCVAGGRGGGGKVGPREVAAPHLVVAALVRADDSAANGAHPSCCASSPKLAAAWCAEDSSCVLALIRPASPGCSQVGRGQVRAEGISTPPWDRPPLERKGSPGAITVPSCATSVLSVCSVVMY